ncbi:MAG TPA: hypothetical protein VFV66_37440 [Nonomuraea sp.]|nr:hypothetical protein [Nonomuraea sp.]
MPDSTRPRRWPAYTLTLVYLGYATGKAAYALQARLGFPGGPPVSPTDTQSYPLDAATAQWLATASGLIGACVALATVTPLAHKIPRTVMLLALAGTLLATGSGATIMIVDGFVGIGIGWQWYHGVLGLVVITLSAQTLRSYARATTTHTTH